MIPLPNTIFAGTFFDKTLIFVPMGEDEIKVLRQQLQQQHSTVTKSKKAAKKLLLELGLITPKGNLSTVFKPLK